MKSEGAETEVIDISDISSFVIYFERDLRRACLAARMLVYKTDSATGILNEYTPISMEVKYVPEGFVTADRVRPIPMSTNHGELLAANLSTVGIDVESGTEKDKRILDLQVHNTVLKERIKFFENLLYKTMSITAEDLNQMRLLREE